MKTLHLFAGAGGGIIADMMMGHTPIAAVEIDPFCRAILQARQNDGWLPKFEIYDDVRNFNGISWRGKVDCLCGGFPCQDISAAGKGEGIHGQRSGLFFELARIVSEIRPKWVFLENSPCIISRGLETVLGTMVTLGYDARWCILAAADIGAPHKRERWWGLFANSDSKHGEKLCVRKSNETALIRLDELDGKVSDTDNERIIWRFRELPKDAKSLYCSIGETCDGKRGGGILNPDWVEYLMGWPPGWTDPETPLRSIGPKTNGESPALHQNVEIDANA